MPAAATAEKLSLASLRSLINERFPDAIPITHRAARPVASGLQQLDRALPKGGFPLGKLSVCKPQGGSSAIMRAACWSVVGEGDRAAWVDAAGTPGCPYWPSISAGDDATPLLVRPRGHAQAVAAADLLLRSGGFRLVVLAAGHGGSTLGDTDIVRLVRAVHEGGGAFVALTPLATMAALRLATRILPDAYRWQLDPFGEPALVREVRIKAEVHALGWNAKAELSIPVRTHELRLSLEPRLADRRGLRAS